MGGSDKYCPSKWLLRARSYDTLNSKDTFYNYNKLPNYSNSLAHNTSSSLNIPYLEADTGASSTTFIKLEHAKFLKNILPVTKGPNVHLPNDSILCPKLQGHLALHDSPDIQMYVLPGMTNASLLSIGQMCDKGCVAMFTKKDLKILYNNKLIL